MSRFACKPEVLPCKLIVLTRQRLQSSRFLLKAAGRAMIADCGHSSLAGLRHGLML